MLSLAIKPGEHVIITDNVDVIKVHNFEPSGIRIAIEASRRWEIIRSDAKVKTGKENDGTASIS